MSEWEMLDDGSFNGVRKWLKTTDDDEGTAIVKYEDVGSAVSIIEANKRSEGVNKKSEMWHVGSIPASLGLKWLVEEGIDIWNPHHVDAVSRKLMDSDYRFLVPGMNKIYL